MKDSSEPAYDSRRRPAWTDRILHWSRHSDGDPIVRPISYQRHPAVSLSDHYPVSAEYEVQVQAIDPDMAHAVAVELGETVTHAEGNDDNPDVHPTITLDQVDIDYGEIRFVQSAEEGGGCRY